jgi:choice-of-anchor B domain-containing protein
MTSKDRRPMPRAALLILVALLAAAGVTTAAIGADPDKGSISLEKQQVGWNGERYTTSPPPGLRTECRSPLSQQKCDTFELTVDIDEDHWNDNTGGAEAIITWANRNDDFDLYVYDEAGDLVGSSAQGRPRTSERVFIEKASGVYTIEVKPVRVADGDYKGGVMVQSRAVVDDEEEAPNGPAVPSEPQSDVKCVDGNAGGFPCKNVDLESYLPVQDIGGQRAVNPPETGQATDLAYPSDRLNDIWGWTDPQTGEEYALVGKSDGVAFVNISDPKKPLYLGDLPSRQKVGDVPVQTIFKIWRDLKVYENHVYIGAEEPAHGLQVFDLTQLRGVTEPRTWQDTGDGFDGFGSSHNIVINEDSGFLYAVGSDGCAGGLYMVDIRTPDKPKDAGCFDADGYTHDAQCVNYAGPDQRFTGREICFNSNEDTLTVVDVTDKEDPKEISRLDYPGATYTHQGWLTQDGRRFLVNDELDEQRERDETDDPATTTRVFDVERLDRPALVGEYRAKVGSIDHNLYVKGESVYEANYRSGLRILDARGAGEGKLAETGFFDVYPEDDDPEFNGAWSNYPYFPSGVVVVSGIEQGLFVLRPRAEAGGNDGMLSRAATGSPRTTQAPPVAAPSASTAPSRTAAPASSCTTDTGFSAVGVRSFGRRGLELGFERRVSGLASVDVFQQSVGRRIIGERLVARYTGRAQDVRWNGRANRPGRRVTDGYYFVRYRVATPRGTDVRRIALRRVGGKWSRRPEFYRRASCDLLRSFKLERPVFGGRTNRALNVSYQASSAARAEVTVLRGAKVVRRFAARDVRARRTMRARLDASKLRRGTYTVRIVLRRGGETVTSTLSARRL